MPDAILDQSVEALAGSAFGCAGERCMAGALALPVGDVADAVVERLATVTRKLKTGPDRPRERRPDGPADLA